MSIKCTTGCFKSKLLLSCRWFSFCFQKVVLYVLNSVAMEKVVIHIGDISHVTPLSKNYMGLFRTLDSFVSLERTVFGTLYR
jgi:hypothetical protein